MAGGKKAGLKSQWYYLMRQFAVHVPQRKQQAYDFRYTIREIFK